jgi:signal transduction histidine kinase
MQRLIEALAALSQLEDPAQPSDLHDVAVVEIVEAAVDQASVEAELRGVVVERRVDDGLRLLADRARLTLALTNLLSNAVKHSPDGGLVSVDARAEGGAVHLLVRDRGPGIAADAAEKLFEKYYRDPAERARRIPGTGLGLYLVRAVADRHRGTASARPAEGGGAEFELVLPQR